jgi:hypothetical protein
MLETKKPNKYADRETESRKIEGWKKNKKLALLKQMFRVCQVTLCTEIVGEFNNSDELARALRTVVRIAGAELNRMGSPTPSTGRREQNQTGIRDEYRDEEVEKPECLL